MSFNRPGLASNLPRQGDNNDSGAVRSNNSSSWGAPRRSTREESDGVQDKFSAAFGRSGGGASGGRGDDRGDRRGGFGAGREEQAPLKMNSRSFGESAPREERGERRGFGGGDRDGGDRPSRNFGGDREERSTRNFGSGGGDRDAERPSRNFGGGDREERPARNFGSGGGDREERPARNFGGGGGDRERGEYRPRERRDEGGWEDDPRFANKFGGGRGGDRRSGGGRGGGYGGSGDARDSGNSNNGGGYIPRRERDAMMSNAGREEMAAMPLPTAPKAAAGNSAVVPKQTVFDMAFAKSNKQQKKNNNSSSSSNNNNKKDSTQTVEAAENNVEESTTPASAPAVVVVTPTHSKVETQEVVSAALATGAKGSALATAITSGYAAKDLTLPMSIFSATLTILQHVASATADGLKGSSWYKADEFGAALKEITSGRSLKEQIDAVYAVQAYCASVKFPKVEVKGKQEKLMEIIVRALLLVSKAIDVDVLLGWADDEVDRDDVPGRVDAIVQMTSTLTTLREPDEEDEDDEGY